MFKSPFPEAAVESIFGSSNESDRKSEAVLRNFYDSSLLRRIDFDDHGDYEGRYRLYYFHPSLKNYLEHKVHEDGKQQELEERYGDQFSFYYYELAGET